MLKKNPKYTCTVQGRSPVKSKMKIVTLSACEQAKYKWGKSHTKHLKPYFKKVVCCLKPKNNVKISGSRCELCRPIAKKECKCSQS